MKQLTKSAMLILCTLYICSCTQEAALPKMEASVVGYYETTAQTKKLVATISLTNIGTYPSKLVAFTLEVQTDKHTYWKTVAMELAVPPTSTMKATIEIPYDSINEYVMDEGVLVYDVFAE